MDKIYQKTMALIGQDASPKDKFNDEFSCTESVCNVLKSSVDIDCPIYGHTFELLNYLQTKPSLYKEVQADQVGAGTIVIAPTGKGNGRVSNGHAVIVGTNGLVYSSDYKTGKWGENGSLTWFKKNFGERGGFPIHYFNYEKRD